MMSIRTYILMAYLLIVGGGFYYLLSRNLEELAPRYLESMEESIVDSVNILASVIETETREGKLDGERLKTLFDGAFERRFRAKIYGLNKSKVDVRVYVADAAGKVIYDSDGGRDVGADYSRWLDVSETLRGKYGARATRENPRDANSLVLYIAAPIYDGDGTNHMIGVVSVGKPIESVNELVAAARRRVTYAGIAGGGLILLLGIAFSMWATAPITRLTEYARAVRDGKPARLPKLARMEGREVRELRQAFEEMRAAIEGKDYVERYVQTLTHEIKSPLSAIKGAAEILSENPPEDARIRFLGNINTEAARIQRIVDQLLQLAALEARKARANMVGLDLAGVAREALSGAQPVAQARNVELVAELEAASMRGDRALLGQAVSNLLQNALEFTPSGGRVVVRTRAEKNGETVMQIEDTGAGIPDYAETRLFEKFYSLPRPGGGPKSTGLGLSLVREIVDLHGGSITVSNRSDGVSGVCAELRFRRSIKAGELI